MSNDKRRRRQLKYENPALTTSSAIVVNQTYWADSLNNNDVVVEDPAAVNYILSKFRRCLCKKVSDNHVAICYLDNNNSNYYHDGTPANLTGSEGYVMVYFPEFYYNGLGADNQVSLYVACKPMNPNYKYSPASLVGAYKSTAFSEYYAMRSVSNSSDYLNYASFESLAESARKNGTGFHMIDYLQHRIIAWMFYAKYKTRAGRYICGPGKNFESGSGVALTKTGGTNSLGMNDTVYSQTSTMINFLGLEGCWGYMEEYMEGIHSDGTSVIAYDKAATIPDSYLLSYDEMNLSIYPTKRRLNTSNDYRLDRIWGGEYGDVTPSLSNGSPFPNGSSYDSNIQVNISENCVYIRGGYGNSLCGLLYLGTTSHDYSGRKYYTSRLAFDGDIDIIDDVNEFKAMPTNLGS